MIITIDDKNIENKLNKLSKKNKKNLTQIIIEIIDAYDETDIVSDDLINKYKKLDPKKNMKQFKFIDDEPDIEMTNPFEHIKNVEKFTKELRKKAWR